MEGSKVCTIIDSFSYLESREFRDYLNSPVFNKDPDLLKIYGLLRHRAGTAAREFDRDVPEGPAVRVDSRQSLHELLFPDRPFDDLTTRKQLSNLTHLAQDFLAFRIQKEDVLGHQLQVLEGLRKKGLEKAFQYELRKSRKILKQDQLEDSLNLLKRHQLEAEHNQFLEGKKDRGVFTRLDQAAITLDDFYLAHKLKYLCAMVNYAQITGKQIEKGIEADLISWVEMTGRKMTPAVRIYFSVYRMLNSGGGESDYHTLRNLLREFGNLFSAEEARDMYSYAQNFCIRKINRGETAFLEEIFSLYRELLEKGILLENGVLSPWDYKNITVVALRLKAFDWAEQFIADYQSKLEGRFRENAFIYNQARLEFSRKRYSRVLRLLQQVDYDDVFYALDSRVILLKTYFELDEIEALDSLVDSFRVFLRRNKQISDHHRKNYLNLVKFTRKLSRCRSSEKKKLRRLEGEIRDADQVADVNWLLEKTAELLS